MILLEYIWLDADGGLRSKTKVFGRSPAEIAEITRLAVAARSAASGDSAEKNELESMMKGDITLSQIPEWNYDGSSTGQACGSDSEVVLKPCAVFSDPFRTHGPGSVWGSKLVLCDTYLPSGDPHPTNTRFAANKLFEGGSDLSPLFGVEQEFFITKDGWPAGFPVNRSDCPAPQGPYYCGVGGEHVIGRDCAEKAFTRCLDAGLALTGMNAEVAPSQWELQVCAQGIKCADQIIAMRYILARTAEEYGCGISFEPKPVAGDWNGSGCHTNFSTAPMRAEGGYDAIMSAIQKLEERHGEHMAVYGSGNDKRMTGLHETADFDTFSYGVANRGASVRIPRDAEKNGRGYLEDRRPASNMDPYVVTSKIFETTSLQ